MLDNDASFIVAPNDKMADGVEEVFSCKIDKSGMYHWNNVYMMSSL